MTKFPTILTRRSIFRAGAGLAVAAAATAAARPRRGLRTLVQAGAEPVERRWLLSFRGRRGLPGDRDLDGYGQLPVRPILVMQPL